MCARIPISLDTCKGLCPLFHYTQIHLQSNVHAHTQTDGERELGFLSNPQTLIQILTDLHLQILHAEALMLLRLIISQVCHCIVTWASKVLTSTSFSLSFAFSMQPGVSCSTIFPVSPFSSFSRRLSPYLPDIAEARVLQVMFSVRSSEKLSKKGGWKRRTLH